MLHIISNIPESLDFGGVTVDVLLTTCRWAAFISGLAYITLPTNDTSTVYVSGGEFGLIFAADTAGLSAQGHRTEYPGDTGTVVLIIPTKDGLIPAHSVLRYGPCTTDDVGGLPG